MKNQKELVMTFELAHPPEKVWRALTEPELLQRWLMKTDLKLQVGQQFEFRREPLPHWDGVVHCQLLEIEAPRFIKYTWRALGLDTAVSFSLEEMRGGTRLTLVQSGFEEQQKQAFFGARGGWKQMLGEGLPAVLHDLA